MDLISLVKDSFEAVAHEVGAACQRNSGAGAGGAVVDGRKREHETVHSPDRGELQMPDGATTSVDLAIRNSGDAAASEPVQESPDVPENELLVTDDAAEEDRSELSVQPSEFPSQLRLLADVMQQASQQLSAVAVGESDEDPQADATAAIQTEQVELRKLFESRIHSDEVQARALERLHNELTASRKQLQRSEMAPLLKDIIFCHDFVTRELERDDETTASVDWRKSFDVLGQMLLDVLFKYDVEPFRGESEEFDRATQQCVRSEHTADSEKDKQIATSGLIGFRTEERILRREQVTVYRYRPSG